MRALRSSRLQRVMGAAALAAAALGCPAVRSRPQAPPEPIPPPAVVEEERLTTAPRATPDEEQGLACARAALVLALAPPGPSVWVEPADLLLARLALEAARDGATRIAAEALYLRGMLALGPGEAAAQEARALLEAAGAMDPLGPFAAPSRLAIRLLDAAARRQKELADLRERLAGAEQGRRREQAAADTLRAEVESLKKQLDELKEVHLRIESEKKDGPP